MPSFGWYECVAFEEAGKDVAWLRLDDLMNAICSFTVDTVGYMSAARQGLKSGDVVDQTLDTEHLPN